ncbi:MAG TPA: hypothetical protein VIG29_07575 [Vicinamibacteria bacterium]
MKFLGRITAGLLGVAAVASAQTAASPWIEFETIDQSALPIVRVKLNGSGGHRLVIDPSFNDFVLDTLVVDGSGLKLTSQGQTEIDYYGRKEKVPLALLEELKVGEHAFSMVRTVLVEGEDGTGMGGLRSYGRIGRDLLKPLRLTVHYPRRLLYLESSPSEVPAGSAKFEASGRFLMVPVSLSHDTGAQEAMFIIDAGTSGTVLDKKWAVSKGFAPKGATGAEIASLRVGDFEAKKLPVLLGEMKELPYGGTAVGVIGADLLLDLSVTYDFPRELIWLVPAKEDAS